jgi:hypothetical protein
MLSGLLYPVGGTYRRQHCARWVLNTACLSALLAILTPPVASAQRTSAMTSFRHAGKIKEIQSLDWIGLYDQLAPYTRWWKETAACAGIPLNTARVDSVQFYFVNAVDFAPTPTDKPNHMMIGVTYGASEQIFIAIRHARTERTVRHEMMHQILYWWGESDWHDDTHEAFKRCGLLIPLAGEGGQTRQLTSGNLSTAGN